MAIFFAESFPLYLQKVSLVVQFPRNSSIRKSACSAWLLVCCWIEETGKAPVAARAAASVTPVAKAVPKPKANAAPRKAPAAAKVAKADADQWEEF